MIHNIDAQYEREIEMEDDCFVLKADLNIQFTFESGGGDNRNEPRYGASAQFVKAEMLMGRSWVPAPKYIREWAEAWLYGAGQDEAVQRAEDDRQPDPDAARDARYDDSYHYEPAYRIAA